MKDWFQGFLYLLIITDLQKIRQRKTDPLFFRFLPVLLFVSVCFYFSGSLCFIYIFSRSFSCRKSPGVPVPDPGYSPSSQRAKSRKKCCSHKDFTPLLNGTLLCFLINRDIFSNF